MHPHDYECLKQASLGSKGSPGIVAKGETSGPMMGGVAGADRLLLPPETSRWVRVSVSTLAKWRIWGRGPRFVRLSGNRVAYREFDIEAWLAGRVVASTSEAGTYSPAPERSRQPSRAA